jgi:hypothetical protein
VFQDNLTVPSLRVKQSKKNASWTTVEDGSGRWLRNVGKHADLQCVMSQKSEDLIYTAAEA